MHEQPPGEPPPPPVLRSVEPLDALSELDRQLLQRKLAQNPAWARRPLAVYVFDDQDGERPMVAPAGAAVEPGDRVHGTGWIGYVIGSLPTRLSFAEGIEVWHDG